MRNLKDFGITKVLIIDDDWDFEFSRKSILDFGVSEDILDELEDDESPDTEQFLKLLERNDLPSANLEERLNAFDNERVIEELPEKFREQVYDKVVDKKQDLKSKLEIIRESLVDLGVPPENVVAASTIEDANNTPIEEVSLVIIDLYLAEGNTELSLQFLENSLKEHKGRNDNPPQFILMSYHTEELRNNHRYLHQSIEVATSQLKVIEKPRDDDSETEKMRWKRSILHLANERDVISTQYDMQQLWSSLVKDAAEKFSGRLWSLDLFSLTKLKQTAEADNLTLADYLSEIMLKNLVGMFEENGFPSVELEKLEEKIKPRQDSLSYSSTSEVYDSYDSLSNILGYISSQKMESESFISSEDEANDHKLFLATLKFGTILRRKSDNKLFVNVTQPCDYIHAKYGRCEDESFILFPGIQVDTSYNKESINSYVSSYVHLDGEVTHLEWNLRLPHTLSIQELFDDRDSYEIVGRLREDVTQALSNKFSAAFSRVGAIRVPKYESVQGFHFQKGENSLTLSGIEQNVPVNDKNQLTYEFLLENGKPLLFHLFRDCNRDSKQPHRVTMRGDSVVEFSKLLEPGFDSLVFNPDIKIGPKKNKISQNVHYFFLSDIKSNFGKLFEKQDPKNIIVILD